MPSDCKLQDTSEEEIKGPFGLWPFTFLNKFMSGRGISGVEPAENIYTIKDHHIAGGPNPQYLTPYVIELTYPTTVSQGLTAMVLKYPATFQFNIVDENNNQIFSRDINLNEGEMIHLNKIKSQDGSRGIEIDIPTTPNRPRITMMSYFNPAEPEDRRRGIWVREGQTNILYKLNIEAKYFRVRQTWPTGLK